MCYGTAMDVIRGLRNQGMDFGKMQNTKLRNPQPWVQERFTAREFERDVWGWPQPSKLLPLHVLVPAPANRVRMTTVRLHECRRPLPPNAIIYLDALASVVSPEMLFFQMASELSLPAAVMLGYELCGHYSRDVENPLYGDVTMDIAPVTSVERIGDFIRGMKGFRGVRRARDVLQYVCDNALSAPESVLATMGTLPAIESAYGLGRVTLNDRVNVANEDELKARRNRYPDLLFSFAPVGINYDGQGHLDLPGLVRAARKEASLKGDDLTAARAVTIEKFKEIRKKVLDDIARNNELMSRGRCVMVATKEDLESGKALDKFMRRLLQCAQETFGVDTSSEIARIDDTSAAGDRASLLGQIYPVPGGRRPKRHAF